jgi:hypothetical protein
MEGIDATISRKPHGKHVSPEMNEKIEELLEAVFSVLFVP